MTVNKLTLPSKDNAVQSKINEIIDNLGVDNIFIATYGTTTYQEVLDAYNVGKQIYVNKTESSNINRYDFNSYTGTSFEFVRVAGNVIYVLYLYSSIGWGSTTTYDLADTDLSNITTVNTQITTTAINPLVNKLTNADITVAPSSKIESGIVFRDNNNNNLTEFSAVRFANGIQCTTMTAKNKISGTEKTAYFDVFVDGSGNDHTDGSAGVKSSIASWAMPSGTAVNITLDASGNWGAATKNGFVYVRGTATGAGGLYLENTTNGMKTFSTAHASGYSVDCFIPVAKGQSIQATMVSGTISVAKFIQAIGG
jgi:hypothetical protein